jgi:hypothetical protein
MPIIVGDKERKPVSAGLGNTFRDFLPDNKIAQAEPLSMPQRSPWNLVRGQYGPKSAKLHRTVQQVLSMNSNHRATYQRLEKEGQSSHK